MNRLCEHIAVAKVDGTYIKWINKIQKATLLILDDFGLQPLTHDIKFTILQILEDRYDEGATIISSQLPTQKWYDYINEPTIADAIMDRITAKASKIELQGKSLRKSS
jgi:DNA replication protein DnaC